MADDHFLNQLSWLVDFGRDAMTNHDGSAGGMWSTFNKWDLEAAKIISQNAPRTHLSAEWSSLERPIAWTGNSNRTA